MKHSILLAAGVAASLAGACSRGPDHVQPGMWEFRLKVTQVDAPGATPEMLAGVQNLHEHIEEWEGEADYPFDAEVFRFHQAAARAREAAKSA